MKCFDLRRKEAIFTYVTSGESVRDIKFSPHEVTNPVHNLTTLEQ